VTTLYVCGPMSGFDQLNEPAFRAAARHVTERGQLAVVPHDLKPAEHEGPCPRSHTSQVTGDHGVACYLRVDLAHILLYCDGLYVLRGWETSVGARVEVQVAAACGIPLEFQP
jgi:hypothetical protein